MNILLIVLLGVAVVMFILWTRNVNKKERAKLEQRLNRDYPVHETHKEDVDPEDTKGA